MPSLPEPARALQRKRTYPHPVAGIGMLQTHISYVFLVDDQVYKLKKPVNFGFLDFSTLEKRKSACEAEVRLNRRGCPGDVYLGVVPLTVRNGVYKVGGDGEVVDYLVHMRRLPREGMMDYLLERNEVDLPMIGRVAARLADLHRDADRGDEITLIGGARQQLQNWRDNLQSLAPFVGRTVSARRLGCIARFAEAFAQREASLMRQREQDGWIRDCHGDLRSDAVCFDPSQPGGICLLDCIEFNDALRYSDTGLDAAFLAMDLDYRGRRDLSDLFIGLYAAAIGDRDLPILLDFYKCYRAVVRAKVESLLQDDPAVSRQSRAAARRRARAYFALAESYTCKRGSRSVVLVTGASGSGKSVLAGALAARLGAVLLSSDMVRRQVFGEGGRGEARDGGIYTPKARETVYKELLRLAGEALDLGRPAVLDGTYLQRSQRQPVMELARGQQVRLLVVECSAPDEVVRQRQQQREQEPWTTSEGRWEIYLAQKALIEPATEAPPEQRLALDTTQTLEAQIAAVEARLS